MGFYNKISVLFVSPLPPPAGGISSWTNTLFKQLLNSDKVSLAHIDTAVRWRSTNDQRLFKRLIRGSIQALKDIKNYLKLISLSKPDVVHICTSGSLAVVKDLIMILIANKLNINSVIHYHMGRIPEIIQSNNLEWKLICFSMKRASCVIVLDQKSFEQINTILPSVNIQVIPNFIDIGYIEKNTSSSSSDYTKKNVAFVGHVISKKGVRELIEASLLLWSAGLKFELNMIGQVENEYRAFLCSSIDEKKGHAVKFYGQVNRDEVIFLLSQADIFVLPSYTEGFPYVIMEAMALGKPIIATNVGAIPEMLDHGQLSPCGVLIQPGSVDELKRALLFLLNHESEALKLGTRAKKKVSENYRLEYVVSELINLWYLLHTSKNGTN